jgi:ADP-ribosylation factor GTPase-activating protein 1
MGIQQKYNSKFAALYRDKIQTEAQGGTWNEAQAKKSIGSNGGSARNSNSKSSASSSSNRGNASSSSEGRGLPKSTSTPTFPKSQANNGSYNSYQSSGSSSNYQNDYSETNGSSYQNGPATQNLTFADRKKIENSSRPDGLRPSGKTSKTFLLKI